MIKKALSVGLLSFMLCTLAACGDDLAIFYDDIYEQTIVEVIPLGHAETGAETMRNETEAVRLGLRSEEGEQIKNE